MKNSARLRSLGSCSAVGLLGLCVLSVGGCKKQGSAPVIDPNDPAMANMAAVSGGTQPNGQPVQVMGQNQQGGYEAQGSEYPPDQQYDVANTYEDQGNRAYDNYEAPQAPPPLPNYNQPPVPRANSIWTPGYWAYNQRGYYWVPGAWVAAPYQGALWTPGYWQNTSGRYRWHGGYWGRHVGFYGGVPYGNGYPGRGFYGGYWRGPTFFYNQAVTDVSPVVTQFVYSRPEPALPSVRVSFNGPGGVMLMPIAAELIAMHERHRHPVRMQYESWYRAGMDPAQFWSGGPRIGVYAVDGVYAPEVYTGPAYVPEPAPVYDRPMHVPPGLAKKGGVPPGLAKKGFYGGYEEGPPERGYVVPGPPMPGAPEWQHGHFDNGWHGHKGDGERGEWHDNGGGEGHGNGHGNGNGNGNGNGHGHGHGHD